mmetsp:Transcript_4451/g.3983  ORF Transcript_4451/g.3983 Transcript_4451/m.3983 type:complete len:98 (+) Transcript_4451:84-377(+)
MLKLIRNHKIFRRYINRNLTSKSNTNINNDNNPFNEKPHHNTTEVSPEVRRNNILIGFTLFSSVSGIYYYSMAKMKQDEFSNVLEEEINKDLQVKKS